MKSLFKKLSFALACFILLTQNSLAVFTDVSSDSPYYTAIQYLEENDIVQGYPDGSFRPEQKLNRAEALKIILLGSKILVPEIQDQTIFPDVLPGTWYAKFAVKAKNLGIVSGDSGTGFFRPGDTINLAEILKILLKTNQIETFAPTSIPYADVPQDAWFAPYFAYAASIHLLPQDSAENVYPAKQITRGLMAELMYGLAIKPEGYQEGKASYYGDTFHGNGTASGEVFDASKFTAAHRTLPFGTWLKVTNLDNSKEAYVRVNDRGPYGDSSRIIDLSKAAFESLDSLSRGVIRVSITPVSEPPPTPTVTPTVEPAASCPTPAATTFATNTFENITLNAPLPDHFFAEEAYLIEGTSSSSLKDVTAFLMDESSHQIPYSTQVKEGGAFSVRIFFPKAGNYKLGVLPGQSGTSIIKDITVLPASCLTGNENTALPPLQTLQLRVDDGETNISWVNTANYEVIRLTFTQGSKQKIYLLRSGLTKFTPNYQDFAKWQTGGVTLELRGANSDSEILMPTPLEWSRPVSTVFKAETHHEHIVEDDKVKVIQLPDTLVSAEKLSFRVDPKVNVDAVGRIILPSGLVETVPLESPSHTAVTGSLGSPILPAAATEVRFDYTPKSSAVHFFEINDEQGIATINIPVYPPTLYPLLPNVLETSSLKPEPLNQDLKTLQLQMLELVNRNRADAGLSPVIFDSKLSQLAQSRSDDMAKRDYFAHRNPDGLTANDLRKDFAITQFVSENLALDVNAVLADYGLMRSASHRENILSPEWKRAGFGISQKGDSSTENGEGTIFVQLFSDDPIDATNVADLRKEIVDALNEKRSTDISLDAPLSQVAQNWTTNWATSPWCDMKDSGCNPLNKATSDTFIDALRDAGVEETLGAYYRGDSSFENAKEAVAVNASLKESRWKKIGLGIKQDNLGIIHFFFAYTE